MFLIPFTLIAAAVGPSAPIDLPAATEEAALARYLLVSKACDQVTGSTSFPGVEHEVRMRLAKKGYTGDAIARMIDGLLNKVLPRFTAALQGEPKNTPEELSYFCSATLKENREVLIGVK